MNILAFDTSLDKTYLSICIKGKYEGVQIKSDENNYHSAYLISNIKKMVEKHNVEFKDLDLLAINSGPGSFTGIRASLAVAKVLATFVELPVVPLNSCEILKRAQSDENAVVLLDARRSMYYFYDDAEIKLILKDDVKQYIENKTVICEESVKKAFCDTIVANFIDFTKENYELEKVLCELAKEKASLSSNIEKDFDYKDLKANYIQTPPVF